MLKLVTVETKWNEKNESFHTPLQEGMISCPLSVHFHIFKRLKLYLFTSKIRFGTCSSSTSESIVEPNHLGRPK